MKERCRAFGMFMKDDLMCQNCEQELRKKCVEATLTKKGL